MPVNSAFLMHINDQYVYPGGDYDPAELFKLGDVTDQARGFISERVPGELARMWEALQQAEPPDIETGRHCTNPYRCPFYGHCHQSEAAWGGATGEATVSPDLGAQLGGSATRQGSWTSRLPCLPWRSITAPDPIQTIPFQWSLHV